MKTPIYLDYQATTPVDARVLEVMLPYFTEHFGNAASRNHPFGWKAEEAVDTARDEVAKLIGASAKEIVFTSGSTEAINLALKGAVEMYGGSDHGKIKGRHIITSLVEHKAVLDTCKHLENRGCEVTYLTPDTTGRVSVEQVAEAMREDTLVVALIWGNNEIGTINPIREIGALCHEKNVLFFVDGTQACGKIPVDVYEDNVDLMCLSAHKLYGPKGVGALFVRRRKPRVRLVSQIDGGGHERGMRSGTLNVTSLVGFGEACRLCRVNLTEEIAHATSLRDRLEARIRASLDEVHLNGNAEHLLPGCLNLSFAYVEGESLLMGINNELAVSSGSACTSASLEPSHVLRAMGVGDDLAHSSIRFGIGRNTTEEEVDYAADRIIETVLRLRDLSPLYEMALEGIDLSSVEWAGH